jgi:hypothetical protein
MGLFRQNNLTHKTWFFTKNFGEVTLANTAEPNNNGTCDKGIKLPTPTRNNKNKIAKQKRFNQKAIMDLFMVIGL